jgi:hypothetical protein
LPAQSITPEVLDKFKTTMLACQSPASTKKLFTTLRAAINFAIKRNIYTGKNPISTQASTYTLLREDNKGERFLTRKQAKTLLNELALRSQHLHDMAFVALCRIDMLHAGNDSVDHLTTNPILTFLAFFSSSIVSHGNWIAQSKKVQQFMHWLIESIKNALQAYINELKRQLQ